MAAALETIKSGRFFSFRAFFHGLTLLFALLLIAGIWMWLSGPGYLNKKQAALPSQTVVVDNTIAPEQDPEHPSDEKQAYEAPRTFESGLTVVPIDGLFEETEDGLLPVIRDSDQLTPFEAYKRPYDVYATDKKLIAIGIMNIGLSDVATESSIRNMPADVSLILSPYSQSSAFWINESRANGHEVWLTLPMESKDYPIDDPGPHTLLVQTPEKENYNKLRWLLGSAVGYTGFVGSYEPIFLNSLSDARPVLNNIYRRGLGFINSQPEVTMPESIAIGMKAPYAAIDVWIDKPPTRDHIRQSLAKLEEIAENNGSAIGIIHPVPLSYQEILEWKDTLSDKGFALAPLSALAGF